MTPSSTLHQEKIVSASGAKSADGYGALKDPQFEPEGYADMVNLRFLNDAELSRNLETRFRKDLSYCYCGNTIVGLNLFYRWKNRQDKPIDWKTGEPEDIFDEEHCQRYLGAQRSENPPHIFAVVQDCYRGLFEASMEGPAQDQALVITGESGAGKTFTTGKVLAFVDAINRFVEGPQGRLQGGAEASMTAKVMATMPIMDAFGNSCMPRPHACPCPGP